MNFALTCHAWFGIIVVYFWILKCGCFVGMTCWNWLAFLVLAISVEVEVSLNGWIVFQMQEK